MTSHYRGLELDLPILKYDAFTISADLHSLSVITHTDRRADQIRVITEALGPIPSPGIAGLLAGVGLLAARRRRRRRGSCGNGRAAG